MNHKRFDDVVKNRMAECHETLCNKSVEYSSGADRHHNFKVAAAMSDTTPELALWGMWVKHLVSVRDLVEFPGDATPELLKEKIGDVINYALLLEGLLTERMDGEV